MRRCTLATVAAEPTASSGEAPEQTRERIIRAARTLFRTRGYDGTAMSQLAKLAGVTTPALYWHFKSKAELCGEMLVRDYSEFLSELAERTVGETAEARLRTYIAGFVELQLGYEDANFGYVQLLESAAEEPLAEVRRLEHEIGALLTTILAEGQKTGEFAIDDLTATGWALRTMCEYVFIWFRPDGRLSAEELARTYGQLAVRMVRSGEAV